MVVGWGLLLSCQFGWGQAPQQRLDSMLQAGTTQLRSDVFAAAATMQAAAALADSLQLPALKAEALNSLGAAYTQQEDYVQSQTVLEEAEQLIRRLKADTLLIDTYTNLGILLERTGKYADAIRFHRKAGQLLERFKAGPEEKARNLTNIGHLQEEQGQLQAAVTTYRQALDLCNQHGIVFGQALLNQNLANVHNSLGRWQESLAFSEISLRLARAHQLPRIEVAAYQNMGASHMLQGRYAEAIGWYLRASDSAQRMGYTKAMIDAPLQLSLCYEKTGQPAQALQWFRRHAAIKDSVFTAEKSERIEALQTAFQTRQKEAAIKDLEQERSLAQLRQQRTNVVVVLLVLLVASLILYAQQRIRRQQAEAGRRQMQAEMAANEEKQRIEREKVLAELNALKAQMNPHFLFNVLNSIQDLFMTGNSRLANEQLGKFSDLTRSILDASGRQAISLQEELDMLRNYLDLESLRFDEQFQYQLQVAPGLDLHGIEIPPMLVQPYVENAIKHGLLHKTSNRRLDVLFSLENPQLLRVEVTDNGVGRQQAAYYRQLRQGGRHKSFATSATEKRLQLLNQGRLANIAVTYTDLQDEQGRATGTTVVVLIPIGQE